MIKISNKIKTIIMSKTKIIIKKSQRIIQIKMIPMINKSNRRKNLEDKTPKINLVPLSLIMTMIIKVRRR
jgi:hypothetical protein